ncbi:MAG: hypothetical protein ABIR29_00050 [Chthoniobacterales bacterium]
MKPSHAAIGAVVLAVAACTAHNMQTGGSVPPHGPWKLYFKNPTLLTNVTAFETILDGNSRRWEKGMRVKKKKGELAHTRPDHTNGQTEPAVSVLTFPSHNQPPNPDSLHVTQKVVLYNQKDFDAILPLIEYQDTSSK